MSKYTFRDGQPLTKEDLIWELNYNKSIIKDYIDIFCKEHKIDSKKADTLYTQIENIFNVSISMTDKEINLLQAKK